ncbi:hypothetical protein CCS01_29935 [Rhodopila globiformis]|uniref:Uncharacterized protein n=1 Tax=Rhodopila globiformis TaxID=1071 RepID=A0A2S6MW42_RHOGL|nr:hypothetical protein CCS01_29935 [Rhodopila globiformis]
MVRPDEEYPVPDFKIDCKGGQSPAVAVGSDRRAAPVQDNGTVGIAQGTETFRPQAPIKIFEEQKVAFVRQANLPKQASGHIDRRPGWSAEAKLQVIFIGLDVPWRMEIDGQSAGAEIRPRQATRANDLGSFRRDYAASDHAPGPPRGMVAQFGKSGRRRLGIGIDDPNSIPACDFQQRLRHRIDRAGIAKVFGHLSHVDPGPNCAILAE